MLFLAALFAAGHVSAQPIDVAVDKDGDRITVEMTARAQVPRAVAWSVLTDYERMASFTSDLKSSAVLGRNGNEVVLQEKGEVALGPMRYAFDAVKSLKHVDGREIRSSLVRGDFKSYEFVTRLADAADGGTAISLHGHYEPNRWIPPGVGPAKIEQEVRKHYEELMAEMVRRATSSPAGSGPKSRPRGS